MKATVLLALSLLRVYFRDRFTVTMSLVLMVFMMVMFGVAMGDDQFNVELPVAVLVQAESPEHQRVLEQVQADDLLTILPVTSAKELMEQIRLGNVVAGLTLTGKKTGDGGSASSITVTIGKNRNKWQRIGLERLNAILTHLPAREQSHSFKLDEQEIPVVRNRYIDYIFPGMLAMAIMQVCLASGVVVLHAMHSGILRRIQITPLSHAQLFGGFISARLLIVALHLLTLGAVATLGFKVQMMADWAALIFMIALGCVTFIALGLTLAVFAPSFEAGSLMVQLLSFPMSFLCGIFFKISNLPDYLLWLANVFPLTYLVEALRGMISGGVSFHAYQANIAVLSSWLCLSLIAAALRLRGLRNRET